MPWLRQAQQAPGCAAAPRAWGGLGAQPGPAGEAGMAFCKGQGRSVAGASGLPWSALAASALSGPAALLSTVGGGPAPQDVLRLSLALAAGASLSPALLMEQRCGADTSDQCVVAGSTHSSAHPWETGLPAHQALRGRWPELTCCSFSSFSRSPESLAPVGRTEGEYCCCCTAAICRVPPRFLFFPVHCPGLKWLQVPKSI